MDTSYWITFAAFVAGFLTVFSLNLLITDLFLNESNLRRKRLEEEQREHLRARAQEYTKTGNLSKLAAEAANLNEGPKTVHERLKELIQQSGLDTTPSKLLTTCSLLLIGVSTLLSLVTRSVPFGLLGGIAVFWLPILWVKYKRSQRQEKLQSQLPDALELMGRILRSGQTMPQAMQAVAAEFPAPIATEFSCCQEQQNLGLSTELSLRDLTRRTGLLEINIFVLALLVHRRAGGNLSELLQQLSGTIRERYKIRGKIKTLTSEGRLQATILLALPPAIFLLLLIMNRPYAVKLFEHPSLIAITLVSMSIGAAWIRKIVNFDF